MNIAGIDIELALNLIIKIGIIIVPVLIAFAKKDKDALARLLAALPFIYGAVEQERRKGEPLARSNPEARAFEIAQTIAGGKLTVSQAAVVSSGLRAINEERRK